MVNYLFEIFIKKILAFFNYINAALEENKLMKNVDRCFTNTCLNGDCYMISDYNYCQCWPGYTGQTCEIMINCNFIPCKNNGTCLMQEFKLISGLGFHEYYFCTCPPNFEGKYCELKTNKTVNLKPSMHLV